jgi:hypothetical protein
MKDLTETALGILASRRESKSGVFPGGCGEP